MSSDAEWYTLLNYIDPTINDPNATGSLGTDAGTKLKATSGWNNNGNGMDAYGFTALGGGDRGFWGGTFDGMNSQGRWWNTSEYLIDYAMYYYMDCWSGRVYRDDFIKEFGLSVRCVKD